MALRQDGFGKSNRIMPKVNVDKPKSDESLQKITFIKKVLTFR